MEQIDYSSWCNSIALADNTQTVYTLLPRTLCDALTVYDSVHNDNIFVVIEYIIIVYYHRQFAFTDKTSRRGQTVFKRHNDNNLCICIFIFNFFFLAERIARRFQVTLVYNVHNVTKRSKGILCIFMSFQLKYLKGKKNNTKTKNSL